MIEVHDLTLRRGRPPGNGRWVLDGVSFEAQRGEVVAIVGPNGSGKTTLLESIVGLRACERGRVVVDGKKLESFRSRADAFAYMPDEASLPEEASVEIILRASANGQSGDERESCEETARRFGIDRLLDRGARELSRGESKRVWLAATLLLNRPILVLDEPFGAFDPLQLDGIVPAVKERVQKTNGVALVTVHQLATAERVADRIVILSAGRVLAQGTQEELKGRSSAVSVVSLEDVFRALLSASSSAARDRRPQ